MTRYAPDEAAWLEKNWARMTNREVADAFSERFRPLSAGAAKAYGNNHGLRKDEGVRGRAVREGRGSVWEPEVDAWFRSFVPGHSEAEISAECGRLFGFALTEGQISGRKAALGVRSGTAGGRFAKGHVPHNKGKTWDEAGVPAESQEAMRRTCFAKGSVPWNAGDEPVGRERTNRYGYVEVKVKRGLQEKANDNYRPKHHLVWERANGMPVPPGTMIVFADRDRRNFDPGNLVAVPRSEWAVIAHEGMPYFDAESLAACRAVARLKSATHRMTKTKKGRESE